MNLRPLLTIFLIILIAVFLGRNIAQASLNTSLCIAIGIAVSIATFLNPTLGLFIIIFSMLLSPEIKVGEIPGRDIVLRLEDFLLIIVTFTWFVKTAVKKELGLFKKTPLNIPIGIYISACVILTLRSMLIESVTPLKGLFYVVKYIEYFILYFMVVNEIQNRRQVEIFIIAFLLTCAITCTYANLHIGLVERVSAPFEGVGEPNTLGGYLVFMLAIVMGIFLYSNSTKIKVWLGVLALFLILPAFLFTLSRTAYIAMVPMWLSLIIFGPKKKMLSIVLLLITLLGITFVPHPVEERIEYTFAGETSYDIEPVVIKGTQLDPSASARIRSWQGIFRKWKERPLLGYGITGLGFIDGQYVRVLGELGIVGLGVFLFLLRSIFKNTKRIFWEVEDKLFKGISLGFLAGFIGLLFFNIGANGFILTRIMEPFWFMAGVVMMFPEISRSEKSP